MSATPTVMLVAGDIDGGFYAEFMDAAAEVAPVAVPVLLVLVAARWVTSQFFPRVDRPVGR